MVATARADGRYQRIRRPLVIEDPLRPIAQETLRRGSSRVKVSQLDGWERQRLLIDGPKGLEPAAFWLSEDGLPMAVPTWKHLFGQANARCRREGVNLQAHAHMLRHTFAVVTLEQLQRGHIRCAGRTDAEQRGHYTRIFGDPLDWVRRRLGHRSVTTTRFTCTRWRNWRWRHAWRWCPMAGKIRATLLLSSWPMRWTGAGMSGRGSTGVGRRAQLPGGPYQPSPAVLGAPGNLVVEFVGEDRRRRNYSLDRLPLPGWHAALAAAWEPALGRAAHYGPSHPRMAPGP